MESCKDLHANVCIELQFAAGTGCMSACYSDTFDRWFSANMGTGIVSILLNTLPYQGDWIYWISVIFFAVNLLLFLVFMTISVLRYLLYPGLWNTMLHHPTMPLFLGTFPISLATVIEMIVLVCGPAWGQWAVIVVSGPAFRSPKARRYLLIRYKY